MAADGRMTERRSNARQNPEPKQSKGLNPANGGASSEGITYNCLLVNEKGSFVRTRPRQDN